MDNTATSVASWPPMKDILKGLSMAALDIDTAGQVLKRPLVVHLRVGDKDVRCVTAFKFFDTQGVYDEFLADCTAKNKWEFPMGGKEAAEVVPPVKKQVALLERAVVGDLLRDKFLDTEALTGKVEKMWAAVYQSYSRPNLLALAAEKDFDQEVLSLKQDEKPLRTAWAVLNGLKWNRAEQDVYAWAAKYGCHGNKTEWMTVQGRLNRDKNPGARARMLPGTVEMEYQKTVEIHCKEVSRFFSTTPSAD